MEQRRVNWPAWLALGISLIALVVALSSIAMSQRAMWTMWATSAGANLPTIPNLPPGWQGREERGQFTPPFTPPARRERTWGERGQVMPPVMWGDRMPGMLGGKGWFSGLLGLIDGMLKLAALALLIWLGIRIFRQRQTPPAPPAPPAPPLTPAGHDPRVE
ncbi:hypothetical protein [uncultured Chloroflexus sp.]|uniref:hypothetical protein n=1 Tax=uncultured Chloroflexus sp. TaxID=214040 RepID=UPI0026281511|nr:hypothetical protein [uncultured Chloroflexus sp.]